MGKSKKADAVANRVAAATAAPVDSWNAEPIFNGDVVKILQQKIRDGMQKVPIRGKNDKKGQKVQKGKEQARSGRKGKGEQGEYVTTCKKNPAPQPNPSNEQRGAKRSRDGNSNSKGVTKKKDPSKKSIPSQDLLKEILELGGTKDDLDLVKDVDSDNDNEIIEGGGTAKGEKDLRSDLEKLMTEAGHDLKTFALQQVVEEGGNDEDDDDEYDEEDEEVVKEVDEEVGVQRVNGTKVLETPSVPTKYTSGKLVCFGTLF